MDEKMAPDLVGHYDTQACGLQAGDSLGYMQGKTLDGVPMSGSAAVLIVPAK